MAQTRYQALVARYGRERVREVMKAKRAAAKRYGPKAKFRIGDTVIIDGSWRGRVTWVGDYDSYIGQRRYKVETADGDQKTWNETTLTLVRRAHR